VLTQDPVPDRIPGNNTSTESSLQGESDLNSPPVYKSTSYKAIHYERQTSLRLHHWFDVYPFITMIPSWCKDLFCKKGVFRLQFTCILPERRKVKRDSVVYDLVSIKEHEAAHTGLMYARSLFDMFADEFYRCSGYRFSRGLQVGPSWVENQQVKTCVSLTIPAFSRVYGGITVPDVLVFATRAIFSAEDLNFMQEIRGEIYVNDGIVGSMDIPWHPVQCTLFEVAQKFYAHNDIKEILYQKIKNRNVLYTFKTEDNGMRQGMMVKTGTGWAPVKIDTVSDIFSVVNDFGVMEFIPAVNRINEEYPSVITLETDPGDMFLTVLGKRKSWVFITYVTEKVLNVLDAYSIAYTVKFSGNKGWHIQVPVELTEPFVVYQETVEAIVNKEVGGLPDEEKATAMMANLIQLEDVKSYKDPFFVARRFVDLVGAHIMFYGLSDIDTVLTLQDLRRLCLRAAPVEREDFLKKGSDIYETERGPVKVEIPQVLSINPYSRFRRQFKLLIDHSSNKREGKLRSVFSLHSKSGLASIPAVVYTDENGCTRFDRRMWDYDFVCDAADPETVRKELKGESKEYPLLELAKRWEVNHHTGGFEKFLKDHRGLLIYLLQNGGEALELLDTPTARWVNANLWERTINSM
jgi:hypothetical protein